MTLIGNRFLADIFYYSELKGINNSGFMLGLDLLKNMNWKYMSERFSNELISNLTSIDTIDGLIQNFATLNITKLKDGRLLKDIKFDTDKELYYWEAAWREEVANEMIPKWQKYDYFTRGKSIILLCIENPHPIDAALEQKQKTNWKEDRLKGDPFKPGFSWRPENWEADEWKYFPIAQKRSDGDHEWTEYMKKNRISNKCSQEELNALQSKTTIYKAALGMYMLILC